MIRSFLYDTANKEKSAYIWNTSASHAKRISNSVYFDDNF